MSGIITGYFGFQRSGKTLMAYMQAERYRAKNCEIYSNMTVPGWIKLESLCDIPFDYKPKVLLLDEAYYFMDSRNWKNNTDSTIFWNTIGKQNILLMLTGIDPGTIEMRIRNQMNFVYLVKGDENYIYYKIIDVVRQKSQIRKLAKTKQLFEKLTYDSNQVPDIVDCSLKNFREKVLTINQQKNEKEKRKL